MVADRNELAKQLTHEAEFLAHTEYDAISDLLRQAATALSSSESKITKAAEALGEMKREYETYDTAGIDVIYDIARTTLAMLKGETT
jgi:hypothetical protein